MKPETAVIWPKRSITGSAHPQRRQEMEHVYSEHGKKYSLDSCVRQMEAMFETAIEECRQEQRVFAREGQANG